MISILRKAYFRLKFLLTRLTFMKMRLRILGARIGRRTSLGAVHVTWPHQIAIGEDCVVEHGVYFKFDGPYQEGPRILVGNGVFIGAHVEFNIRNGIRIGDHALVGAGTRFVDHDHGIAADTLIKEQSCPEAAIEVGRDCWLGANCVVLKGVTIGDGSVVGAGAVVTRSIPPMEIWTGVPAKPKALRVSALFVPGEQPHDAV